MRPIRPTILLLLLLLDIGVGMATAQTTAGAEFRSPQPVYREAPAFPAEMANKGVRGEANIVCVVDEQGRVAEAVIRDASRREFGQAALEAARLWRFDPAVRGGAAVSSRVIIPFVFNDGLENRVESVLRRKVYVDVEGPIVNAESLGTWPRPVTRALPRYPQALKGTGKKGMVMVSIVIDHNGHVVNPTVVKAVHEEFVVPAIASAASFKFRPILDPMGDPVNVNMVVEFTFNEKMLKEEEKDKQKRIVIRRPMRDGAPEQPSR